MNIVLFEESEINLPLSIKDNRGKHITQILHKKEGEFLTLELSVEKQEKQKSIKSRKVKLNLNLSQKATGNHFIHFQ